jgi:hypothetical protein
MGTVRVVGLDVLGEHDFEVAPSSGGNACIFSLRCSRHFASP